MRYAARESPGWAQQMQFDIAVRRRGAARLVMGAGLRFTMRGTRNPKLPESVLEFWIG
jgi:hypothetical protein